MRTVGVTSAALAVLAAYSAFRAHENSQACKQAWTSYDSYVTPSQVGTIPSVRQDVAPITTPRTAQQPVMVDEPSCIELRIRMESEQDYEAKVRLAELLPVDCADAAGR